MLVTRPQFVTGYIPDRIKRHCNRLSTENNRIISGFKFNTRRVKKTTKATATGMSLNKRFDEQAPVKRLDNTIPRINHYPVDTC